MTYNSRGGTKNISARKHEVLKIMDTKKPHGHQQIEKKQHEREILEEFQRVYPDFPSGEIIDSEEPDFLILTDAIKIGIELMEYNKKEPKNSKSSSIRQKESFHRSLANEARARFEEKYNVSLQVVFFGHGHLLSLNRKELDQLASGVAEMVASYIPSEVGGKIRLGSEELAQNIDTEGDSISIGTVIHSIQIIRLSSGPEGIWSFSEVSWIDVDAEKIQSEIQAKEQKIGRYLQQCASVWLLIVTGEKYIATMASPLADLKQHCFISRFERIIVYDRLSQSFTRLLTIKEE